MSPTGLSPGAGKLETRTRVPGRSYFSILVYGRMCAILATALYHDNGVIAETKKHRTHEKG